MDESESWSETSNPEGTLAPSGRKAKGKAPLPPGEGKYSENSPSFDSSDSHHFSMDQKENIIDRDIDLTVVLPGEKTAMATVHGSKPTLDLLIFLCGQYRLNPSSHTIDLISSEGSQIKFKPNTPIGMLEVEKVVLKSKVPDDKNKKPFPTAPEQTVRVVINYRKTQKTVMRVSPQVPLHEFFLSICNKCEFDPVHTVLLKDHQSPRPLDLNKSLNDLGIRELCAVDRSKATSPSDLKPPPLQEACQNLEAKPHEDKGFFNFFRRSKKKRDQTSSAPTTPQLNKARFDAAQRINMVPKSYDSNTMPSMPSELPKKRRAPLPPMHPPQSAQNSISRGQVRTSSCIVKSTLHETEKAVPGIDRSRTGSLQLSGSSSFNSPLRRTKRKAPLPPSPPPNSSQDGNYENGTEKAQVSEEVIYEKRVSEEERKDTTAPAADISEPPLEDIKEKEETTFSYEIESEGDKTEDVSVSSVSTDAMGDVAEESFHSGSDMANGSKTSEEEIMIISDKSSPVKVDDITAGSATLEYDHKSHIGNGTSTQMTKTEDDTRATKIKILHIITELQTLPCVEHSEHMITDIQDNATVSVSETEGTLDHSSPTKAKMQDSAVQTVSFDSGVEMNGIKESSQTVEPSLEHLTVSHKDVEINGQSPVPPQVTHQHVEVSKKELQAPVEKTSMEIPSAKESMHTQTDIEMEKMVESPLKSPSKSHQLYIQDSEPKPKPSNEITRDYLPKIGMTTYKIVPQKSFDAETENGNYDSSAQHDKWLQSPTGTKNVSPIQAAREAFFSELSSAVKNGSHSPQLKAKVNPMNLTYVNNTVTSPKEHPGLTRSLSSAPVLKSEKSNVPETKPVSVKAPSSFYLQMQRRASSLYVTSAAAKVPKPSSSPTNNTFINLGKDTLPTTIKTLPPSLEAAQVTTKQEENISDGSMLCAENKSLQRNLEPVAVSQITSKTPSPREDIYLPSSGHNDLHRDKPTLEEMESEVQSLRECSQLTQKLRLDVRLPSISEDEQAKGLTEERMVETVSGTFSVATNSVYTSLNITEMDNKFTHANSESFIVNAGEEHLESPSFSAKIESENSLSAGVKNFQVKTEPLNVSPEVTKHFDVEDKTRHYEDSLTSSSQTVRSPSSPTGPAVTMSLQKLRTFATPRPFSSCNSSSFAPTSSLAIRRSQSFTSSSAPVKQPLKSTGWTSVVSPTEAEFRNDSSSFSENSQEQSEDRTLTPEIKYRVHSPPPVAEKKTTVSFDTSDPELIRQNLLAAIRSGEAAANLKRVPVQSNTISINGRSRLSHPVFSETQEEL